MARVAVFGIGQLSRSPYVSAKQIINMFCEKRPAGEKSTLVAYRTPGLVLFSDFGGTSPARGARYVETINKAYVVVSNVLYEVDTLGAFTNRGTLLTSSGRVSMSDNGVQVMIVDGTYGYIYNTNTLVFAQITDVDFPANPTTVTYLSRRFDVTFLNSSRHYWSDIDDGLSWDTLNFANAEASPDPIAATWANSGQLILLGTSTTEFWGDSGTLDQAFIAIKGTANEWGLAATNSVAKYDNSIAMLIRNRMGQVMVAQMAGYLPKKISNPDIDEIINAYSTVNDATAYSYMLGGHPMYVISFPTVGATWLYDGSTSIWSQLQSYGFTRHRGEFSFSFGLKTIVADSASGKLYQLTDTVYTDNGDQIESILVSETVASPDLDRLPLDKFRVDMQVGMGSTAVPFPQVGLSVSRDNGHTYGAEQLRDIGPIGNYANTADWNRLGEARNFVFKLRVTDAFPFTLISAMANPDD